MASGVPIGSAGLGCRLRAGCRVEDGNWGDCTRIAPHSPELCGHVRGIMLPASSQIGRRGAKLADG